MKTLQGSKPENRRVGAIDVRSHRGGGGAVQEHAEQDPHRLPGCQGHGRQGDGGRRADLLPAGHLQDHDGDDDQVQQREGRGFQHLPVLPQGGVQ